MDHADQFFKQPNHLRPVWLNGQVFVYKLSVCGLVVYYILSYCGFESRSSHLKVLALITRGSETNVRNLEGNT